MVFILFIYLICFINLLLYIYDYVCHDDDDDGKSPEYRRTPPFSHIIGLFLSKVAISLTFKIIGFFVKFLALSR